MKDQDSLQPLPTRTVALLAITTATAPARLLADETTRVLTDLFPDIRSIEQATRTAAGQQLIAQRVGKQQLRNMQEFWDEEWVV